MNTRRQFLIRAPLGLLTATAAEVYVHRIGRTGRIGREGVALTLVHPREQRPLKAIESLTKQRIEVRNLPTEADLRKRRLEAATELLKDRLAEGGLDEARGVVEALVQEFDILEVAAAAVAMINEGLEKSAPEPEAAEISSGVGGFGPRPGPDARPYDAGPRPARRGLPEGPMTLLRLSVGKDESVRPADLVGAIAGEAKVPSSVIGAIKIHDDYSLVEVPEQLAERIVLALKRSKIRGHTLTIQSKPVTR